MLYFSKGYGITIKSSDGSAMVVDADIEASNGIIHSIDAVL